MIKIQIFFIISVLYFFYYVFYDFTKNICNKYEIESLDKKDYGYFAIQFLIAEIVSDLYLNFLILPLIKDF